MQQHGTNNVFGIYMGGVLDSYSHSCHFSIRILDDEGSHSRSVPGTSCLTWVGDLRTIAPKNSILYTYVRETNDTLYIHMMYFVCIFSKYAGSQSRLNRPEYTWYNVRPVLFEIRAAHYCQMANGKKMLEFQV